MRQLAAATALLLAGCASREIEIRRIMLVDGSTPPVDNRPLDLSSAAMTQGCAYVSLFPGQAVVCRVVEVVSPREFIIDGRYGPERVRPWMKGATLGRLEQQAARHQEITAWLSATLVGRELFEPAWSYSPVASADGLRVVRLGTLEDEPVDLFEIVDALLEDIAETERSVEPATPAVTSAGLAPVARDAETLRRHVEHAVALAERYSGFRSPPELAVRWASFSHPPSLTPSQLAAWRDAPACMGRPPDSLAGMFAADRQGFALPGGTVYLDSDYEWSSHELDFALIHELMHQHQFALCSSGALLKEVPILVLEGHASSLTKEILQASGADDRLLDLVVEIDGKWAAAQAFDAMRIERGASPDDLLIHLAANPDQARCLTSRAEFGQFCWCSGDACAVGDARLQFDIERLGSDRIAVAISNASDRPFVGFLSGYWHFRQPSGESLWSGGTPFTLRLPPHASLVIEKKLLSGHQVEAGHAVYRETVAATVRR